MVPAVCAPPAWRGEHGDRQRHHQRPIWLTILIGIVAAIVGTLIATVLGVGSTRGIDWIELFIQVALAAVGVSLVAGRSPAGRRRF